MTDPTQVTLYDQMNSISLVRRYDQDYQNYREQLKLSHPPKRKLTAQGAVFSKVLIGSFLAFCAVSTVFSSNYIDYRIQQSNGSTDSVLARQSWVFPVYFMAGVFSVSSILVFRRALK